MMGAVGMQGLSLALDIARNSILFKTREEERRDVCCHGGRVCMLN